MPPKYIPNCRACACSIFSPYSIPDDILKVIMRMQHSLRSAPIWGPDIEIELEKAIEILVAGMMKLSNVQRTQFTLLSGMYNAGVLIIISTILGFMSFERYVELKSEGLQPDSAVEQELRSHIAYIELLGKLGM